MPVNCRWSGTLTPQRPSSTFSPMTTPKRKSAVDSPPDFERALAELEQLISTLEQGDIALEDALQRFERGIVLARHCQTALQQAEQRVEQLVEQNGQLMSASYPDNVR